MQQRRFTHTIAPDQTDAALGYAEINGFEESTAISRNAGNILKCKKSRHREPWKR